MRRFPKYLDESTTLYKQNQWWVCNGKFGSQRCNQAEANTQINV